MNKEWQEATNEYMKVCIYGERDRPLSAGPLHSNDKLTRSLQENKIEPISFVGAEDYKGPGAVQSGPKPKE